MAWRYHRYISDEAEHQNRIFHRWYYHAIQVTMSLKWNEYARLIADPVNKRGDQ